MDEESTAWPWGEGKHYHTKYRAWCSCGEWCYEPEFSDQYDQLCMCCREPLYELRMAELEKIEQFAEKICAVFEEYPNDSTQPFAGYEQILEWVKQSRQNELDYLEVQGRQEAEKLKHLLRFHKLYETLAPNEYVEGKEDE